MVTRSQGCFCLSCSRTPEQCPSVVSLLAESYNPHVRYGAAMALGIACAGTGLKVSSIIRICMSARVKICQLTQRFCAIFFFSLSLSLSLFFLWPFSSTLAQETRVILLRPCTRPDTFCSPVSAVSTRRINEHGFFHI